MTIAALPAPPDPTDSTSTFNSKAFSFLAALPDFRSQANDLAAECNGYAVAADASADAASLSEAAAGLNQTAASASALAAAASAGAAAWVSGATYAVGDVRWSPASEYVYRRKTNGAGGTDPASDPTNWALAGSTLPQLVIVSGTTQTASSNGHYSLENVAATTLTLPASPAVGDAVWITASNGRTDNIAARNGQKIMAVAEDMTLDQAYLTTSLRYINATVGWVLV